MPLAALLLAACVPGCWTLDPASLDAQPPRVAAPAGTPASVEPIAIGAPSAKRRVRLTDYSIDLDAWTHELARLVEEGLGRPGAPHGGDRIIRLQVVYLEWLIEGPCLIDYAVFLGDAPAFGAQGRGGRGTIEDSCREALEAAASQILRDRRTAAYLAAP